MATQNCLISAPDGYTSLTMRARTPSTGAVVQSVSVNNAEAADPTLYKGVFTDLTAGRYKFTLEDADGTIAAAWFSVLLENGTYSADDDIVAVVEDTGTTIPGTLTSIQSDISSARSEIDVVAMTTTSIKLDTFTTIPASIAAVKTDTETLLSRVTTTVATLWANLTAMITGSGASAAYTTKALENAPGGSSGSLGPADIDAIVEGVTAVAPRVKDGLQGQYRLIQGDTWSQVFSIASAGADRVVISVKRQATDTDSESVLLVDSDTGILVLNGASSGFTADDGSVAFDASSVTLTVESNVTIEIPADTYFVTVKKLDVGSDRTYELRGRLSVPAAGITATS